MSDARGPQEARREWRSLEQLADDPRAREFLEREFPVAASELPEGISRRSMLTLLGASLSAAGLTACRRPVEEIVPYVRAPEEIIPGVPLQYATTMPAGLTAYGLLVESHEGRPTKIEGNPLHPATAGASSAQLQAALLGLYDPDRSTRVETANGAATWADFVQAWALLEAPHLEQRGAGLALISGAFASPTLARLRARLFERFPAARWAVHEPWSPEPGLRGVELATGQALLPVYRLERARVILALDADFLLTEPDSVRHSLAFADGRRVVDGRNGMNRLYVVEAARTVTGSSADHRLQLGRGRVAAFVAALGAALARRGVDAGLGPAAAAEWSDEQRAWLEALAGDLAARRGAGLILAGSGQPAEVHAAVIALNAALGNLGQTVELRQPIDAALPEAAALVDLVAAMRGGQVSTLIVLGANPVYDAPADLEFAAALTQVPNVIHLGLYRDETGQRAGWHLPQAHFLESWSDARSTEGSVSIVQPLVLPLYGGKSDVELLTLLATGAETPGHDAVRESWRGLLGETGFEQRWSRTLHDGLLIDGAPPGRTLHDGLLVDTAPSAGVAEVRALPERVGAALAAAAPAGAGLELLFTPSHAVHDGRLANNGWLQELPDPVTKLTWDNAALIAPATAAELGLGNEALVRVSQAGRAVDAPVWIVPGQAPGTVALALGYGRSAAGRVGNGTGFDAYPLRTTATPGFAVGAVLTPLDGRQPLAQTQDHGSMKEPDLGLGDLVREGRVRPLVRQAALDEYLAHPEFAREMVEVPHTRSMWAEHTYTEGNQWGMTIDLNACTGCNACVIACQSENNIPIVGRDQVRRGREMHWIRIDRYFNGAVDDPQMVFQPVNCMHCENAPCEQVCPVAATVHDSEGLNSMAYNRCIGTRYCANNCPYKVRRFNFYNFTKDNPEAVRLAANPDVTVRSRGVMEKCTYCTQRIQEAKIEAKLAGRELRDGDVQTACQQACPTRAISFGNILDGQSEVARRKLEPRNYSLLDEIHTKPRTTYLARLRNPNPELHHG